MDIELAKAFYRQMLLIRRFEEKCVEMYSKEKIRGFLHLSIGQEAVAVGVMHALGDEDTVISTYREHGHAIARGVAPERIMAELFGKTEGCTHGRGGSMHLFDAATRFYGGWAIVGGALPLAGGMALADKQQKRSRVTVSLFGDGAVAEGEFHEVMNLAVLWQLPILFVCENNLYGMGTALKYAESETNLARKAAAYGMEARQVDGMDVFAVAEATQKAAEEIRSGLGPVFLECLTYRFRAHSMYDAELYRDKQEVEQWKKKGPLVVFKKRLEEEGMWEQIGSDRAEKEAESTVNAAVDFAENGTLEPLQDLTKFVYSEEVKHG